MLLDNANVAPLDVTPYAGSERPFSITADTDDGSLDATRNVERCITGEEKRSPVLPMYGLF